MIKIIIFMFSSLDATSKFLKQTCKIDCHLVTHLSFLNSGVISGNTTNLQFHLDNHHKEETCETPPTKTTGSQPPIDQAIKGKAGAVFPRMSKLKQDEIDDALMQLMVQKVLPLSLVEHDKFLNFVKLLDSR